MKKDGQLLLIQLGTRPVDFRQIMVSVHSGGRIPGKMFATAQNPLLAHRVIECAGQSYHLLDSLAVATAPERIIRLVVERNVEHRTEIKIEPEDAQKLAGDFPVAPDQCNIVPVAQLLGIRRLVPNQPQARDAPSLLIDRNDRLDLTQIAQIVDQLPELPRALNVAAKKNKSARLDATKQTRRFRIQFEPWNSGKDQLTERIALHNVTLSFHAHRAKQK